MKASKCATKEAAFHDDVVSQGGRAENRYYAYESMTDVLACQDRFLGDISGKSVLDFGCGTGWLTIDLLKKGAEVFSIDISGKSIERTIERVKQFDLGDMHQAAVMDCLSLDFADNTFDVIAGNGILHHLPDIDLAIQEIKRVLKPNGYAVFYEPLGHNPLINLYRRLTPSSRTDDEHPLKAKELKHMTKEFTECKFCFFGLFDVLSKIFSIFKKPRLEQKVSSLLKKIDRLILGQETDKVTFINKMSWIVVIKLVN